jgi:hypothetical protein
VDTGLLFFLVFTSAIIFAFYAYSVAEAKGHDGSAWGVGGFLLGPVALLASLGLPDLKTRKYLRLIAEKQGVDLSGEPGIVQEQEGAPYDHTYWEKYDRKPKE